MTGQVNWPNIKTGQGWVEVEIREYALERDVRISGIHWTDSPQAKAFILEIASAAGEHTISLSYEMLATTNDENTQLVLRQRVRGLVGDLARIERRGSLR